MIQTPHDALIAAIQGLRPDAQWSMSGDTYEGIEWLDKVQAKPTEAEVAAYVPVPSKDETRAAAFKSDASRADLMTRLKTATPAQIDTFVNSASTVAKLQAILSAVLKTIALDGRS